MPRPRAQIILGGEARRVRSRGAKMTLGEPEKALWTPSGVPSSPHFRCAIMRRTPPPGAARADLGPGLPFYEGTFDT